MKVEQGYMVQLKLTDIKGLDPVRVMIEEYGKGSAKVVIECYGESWSSYWGSMGGSLIDFFTRTNVGYLVNCFDRGICPETNEINVEATKLLVESKLKSRIIERRREDMVTSDEARYWYDNYKSIFLADLKLPEHPYDTYSHWDESCWYNLFGCDKDDMNWWLEENMVDIYEVNHKYDYLCRIVDAVQKAVVESYKPLEGEDYECNKNIK